METGIIIYLTLQLIWCGFAMYHMKKEIPDYCGEPLDNKIFSNLKLTLNRNK